METQRAKLLDEAWRRLGGGLVKIELTPDHFNDALNFALSTYRQRSSNAFDERYTFLQIQPDQDTYYLPDEVKEVRQVIRHGYAGSMTGWGNDFDPFSAAVVNQTLLGQGSLPSLVTYELFTGYQELVGKMFGLHVLFNWRRVTNELQLMRKFRHIETVMLWVYMEKPEEILMRDIYARPWLLRYTVAYCKLILGESRGKFATYAGPQGGTSLNGSSLAAEGQAEIDALLQELKNSLDQDYGYGFILG